LLNELFTEFNDWLLVLAAYNAGPGAVRRAQRRAGALDYASIRSYLPAQTRRYIPRVLAVAQVAMNPHYFGLHPASDTKPLLVQTTARPIRLSELARQYGISKKLLLQLNPSFLKRRVSAGSDFFIPNISNSCLQPPTIAGIGTWLHYQSQFGETLQQISQRSGYSLAALKAWNKLNSTVLYPGQTIFIPSGGAVNQLAA
jgi:membrane-bound lytic murein transglycosylase D